MISALRDECFEARQKVRLIRLVHMVVVPKPRRPHLRSISVVAQPIGRVGINGRLFVIAEKGNRVSLNEAAIALWPGLIINPQPKKRKGTGMSTDHDLEWCLDRAQLLA